MGARPKVYGGNTTILGTYAGVSTGIQERLRNMEAPFGSGGNFEATSYGKKWIEKPTKGILKRGADSIDQEKERMESREIKESSRYQPIIDLPNKIIDSSNNYSKPTNDANNEEKSYMEQKREEYRRYLAENQQNYEAPVVQEYDEVPQDQQEDYYDQEARREQLQYELEQQISKLNSQNKKSFKEQEFYPSGEYTKKYPDQYANYQPYVQPIVIPSKPKIFPAAGGKSIRQHSEENKFTISGYSESELKSIPKSKIFSKYETSSNTYGNTDSAKLGIVLNANNIKAYGRQSSIKDKGFNVITGEYAE